MIIYNVTVKVSLSIASGWMVWMQEEHIPALLQTGCFTYARCFRLLEQDDREGPTYVIQYGATNRQQYQLYIDNHAEKMRAATIQKWGDQCQAFRTLMEQKFEQFS